MNSSSRNGARVIWLAVHTTEGIMRARDLLAWASWPGSSHASNDETGVLLTPAHGFVPYDRAAWTLRNGNPISENIEQCGWARWTRAEWLARPLLLETTAQWLAARSTARGIPLRRLSDAEIRNRVPGVIGHGDYSRATGDGTHTDPGPNYPWDVVLARANDIANGDDMPSVADLWNYPVPDPDKPGQTVPIGVLLAQGASHAFRANTQGAQKVWDYQVPDPDKAARTGDAAAKTPARDFLVAGAAQAQRAAAGVQQAVAAQDPVALAAAIAEAMPAAQVAEVASRLTVAVKSE